MREAVEHFESANDERFMIAIDFIQKFLSRNDVIKILDEHSKKNKIESVNKDNNNGSKSKSKVLIDSENIESKSQLETIETNLVKNNDLIENKTSNNQTNSISNNNTNEIIIKNKVLLIQTPEKEKIERPKFTEFTPAAKLASIYNAIELNTNHNNSLIENDDEINELNEMFGDISYEFDSLMKSFNNETNDNNNINNSQIQNNNNENMNNSMINIESKSADEIFDEFLSIIESDKS